MAEDVVLDPKVEQYIQEHFGISPMLELLGGIQRPLPHLVFGPWRKSKAPRNNEFGDITVFKKSHEVQIRVRLAAGKGVSSKVRTLAGVPIPKFDCEALRSFADFAGTLVEGLGVVTRNPTHVKRRTDILPEHIDIGSLAVGRYLKSLAHLGYDPSPILLHLRALSQQTYEGSKIPYGLILTRRMGGVGTFPDDVRSNKRYRSVSDGWRTALRLDRERKVLGLTALGTTEPSLVRSFRPRIFQYLAAASSKDALGLGLSEEGDIVCLHKTNMTVSLRHGQWQVWNHQENVALLRRSIHSFLPRSKKKERRLALVRQSETIARAIYTAALDLSFQRRGALLVVLEDPDSLSGLIDQDQVPGDPRRAVSDRGLDLTLVRRNQNVAHLPVDVLFDLAGLDGAVILAPDGRVLSYGAIVKFAEASDHSYRGARWQACQSSSQFGAAVMVSSDGAISFVRKGKLLLRL